MAVEITLAQFNKIAIGDYNAGFVDFKTDDQGNVLNELRKVNNHVHMRGKNKEEISPERVLQVKEALIDAMRRGNVSEESIKEIRRELGIPTELDVNATPEARSKMLTARYTPLTRTQTRYLLDKYAEGGRGFGPGAGAGITAEDIAKAEHTRTLSGSDKTTRMSMNMANIKKALGHVDYATTDVLSILSLKRPLTDLKAAMDRRHPGDVGAAQREVQERNLSNSYTALFSVALKLLGAGANESPEFEIMEETVKLVKSNRAIKSITLEKSLGAASVGEAFLCTFAVDNGKGGTDDKKCVVKIMRHDAESRVKEEAKIFNVAAEKVPGMAKTWAGQLKQYMTEFDFRTEAQNVNIGVQLYDIKRGHDLFLIARDVRSMKMSNLFQPEKNVMVAEAVYGTTVDTYFKENVATIRKAADAVFEQEPENKRIKWKDGPVNPETGKPTKVPVMKKDLPGMSVTNLKLFLSTNYKNLESTSKRLLQATQAWFKTDFAAAGDNQELRSAAITKFANAYASETGKSLDNMRLSFDTSSSFVPSRIPTPMSFASAITGILLDNFEDVQRTLGSGGMALGMNASDIARNELHADVGMFDVEGIINAIKADAKKQGGEKDYKVDIGV